MGVSLPDRESRVAVVDVGQNAGTNEISRRRDERLTQWAEEERIARGAKPAGRYLYPLKNTLPVGSLASASAAERLFGTNRSPRPGKP